MDTFGCPNHTLDSQSNNTFNIHQYYGIILYTAKYLNHENFFKNLKNFSSNQKKLFVWETFQQKRLRNCRKNSIGLHDYYF